MRIIIFILLLCPIFSIAQKTDVFIKLTDVKGQAINGESVTRFFENWIPATSINSAGKNNTQLNFTMTVNGASADLKRAMSNGDLVMSGQVTVLSPNQSVGRPVTLYTILMEKIAVSACYEAMACDNVMNTTVTLQATRIGWIYYTQSKTGAQTVSRKFGWDAENNSEWVKF
jgi:type VI protein secretion system component Hcp